MAQKFVLKLGVFLLLVLFFYYNSEVILPWGVDGEVAEDTEENIQYNEREMLKSDIDVAFCPSQDCYDLLLNSMEDAKSEIKCAFYELDEVNISKKILEKAEEGINVQLVIDNEYVDEENLLVLKNRSGVEIVSDIGNSKYMHNKFCVIDEKVVLTGSMNPTFNGVFRNNNNLIKIGSSYLAQNYLAEFNQLFSKKFGVRKESVLRYNNVTLVYEGEDYLISSYFCPQDDCAGEVLKILNLAEKEIIFASFSFTYDDYADVMLKKAEEGVSVSGVIETRMRNVMGSEYARLNESIEVYLDENKYNMHHKVFVVDGRYVVTGSMNPSGNAVNYNDENILIIDNERIARLYKQEVESLFP